MGRQCKCCICKTKKDSSEMYKYMHFTKGSNKPKNKYYCSRIEFHNDLMDKKYYNKTQKLIDEIVGYVCVNNKKNTMITNLYKIGYSRKLVYECISFYEDEIIKALEYKKIDKEYPMLCYVFAIIKSKIKDFSSSEKSTKTNKTISEERVSNIFEDTQDTNEVKTNAPINRRRSIKDRLRGVN